MHSTDIRQERSPPYNYEHRPSNYTPLATSIEHIFEVRNNKGLFRKPSPLSQWKSRDNKRYCEYHESSGHNTYECRQLNDEIEDLIKEGYLGEYIVKEVKKRRDDSDKNKDEGRDPRSEVDEKPRPPKVFRGESADIKFSEEDAKWVRHPHNDALVVAM